MRLRSVRITMRRLMGAVLLIALLLAAAIEPARLVARRRAFLGYAENHAYWEYILKRPDMAAYWEERLGTEFARFKPSKPWPSGPPFVPFMLSHHTQMRGKWERAASRPWLPVTPDPPARWLAADRPQR